MLTSVTSPPGTVESISSELRLVVPNDPVHVRAVRLLAVDTAARAGFDCDRVDDLRIAVDELCHGVLACTNAPLSVRFTITGDAVQVEGEARRIAGSRPFELGPVPEMIVRAVTPTYEIFDTPTVVRFELRMAASVGAHR